MIDDLNKLNPGDQAKLVKQFTHYGTVIRGVMLEMKPEEVTTFVQWAMQVFPETKAAIVSSISPKDIADTVPKTKGLGIKLNVPKTIDRSFLIGDKHWNHPMLYKAFLEINDEVTKEDYVAAMRTAKITIKSLDYPPSNLPVVMLKELPAAKLRQLLVLKDGFLTYPTGTDQTSINRRVILSLALKKNPSNWGLNISMQHYTGIVRLNAQLKNPLPELEIATEPMTEELFRMLKTGLSPRHINDKGHYNYPLIQMELYMFHNVFYKPAMEELMPKPSIQEQIKRVTS